MKLSAAALSLAASAALVAVDGVSATSAGQCLSAVSAYANSGVQADEGIEWNDAAAYYHAEVEADEEAEDDRQEEHDEEANDEQEQNDADEGDRRHRRLAARRLQDEENEEEQAAEQAEATIFDQMQGLAEALNIRVDDDKQQEGGEDVEEQKYQDLTYVMAYDEDLADALGIEDRDTFAQFYELTYDLANRGGCDAMKNGRRLQDDEDEEDDREEEDEEQKEEEGEAEEDNVAEEMEEDLISSILRNCQDDYEDLGINLEEIEEDDDKVKNLSLHIRIEQALANGQLNIKDKDYEQGFADLVDLLGLDYNEMDEEDATNIMLKLAVKAGDLTMYLMDNAAYGTVVEDWDELLQGFFESIGMEGVNLDDIDPYLAADIYNKEYDIEEYGCQQAMISQFGKKEATNRGYIKKKSLKSFLDSCKEKLSGGAIAGIVIAVLAAVALVACGAFKCGQKGANDKKKPLINVSDKHSDTSEDV